MHDPPRYQGPFIDPPRGGGLLRRLFGRGGGDRPIEQTSLESLEPRAHDPVRTSAPPHTHAPTTARSVPGAGRKTVPSMPQARTRRRGIGRAILGWAWRFLGWRLILGAVFGIIAIASTLNGSGADRADPIPRVRVPKIDRFEIPPAPGAPGSTERSGTGIVRVERIDGTRITVTDIMGRTYDWFATDPAVRRELVAAGERRVIATWERNDADNVVIRRVLVTQARDDPARTPART